MKRAKKSTIRDVAAAAGVSLTTVSDALSGKGRLPEATRKKVHEVAAKLNYRPNAIARGLRGQGLGLIGISIAPAKSGAISDVWFWASIAMHATDAMLSEGFAPILLPHDVSSLQKLRVPLDGALVVDPLEDDPVLALFRSRNVSAVTIGYDPKNPRGPWIDDDNEKGIAELLSKTVTPGERIAFVTFGPRKSYVIDVLRGLNAWAGVAGSDLHELHCAELDDASVDAILQKVRARRSNVVVAQNDRVAVKILAGLKATGVRVPEDIRLLSATDAPELQNSDPTISALRQHPDLLGELAARLLFDVIRGVRTADHQLLLMDIVLRGSAPPVRSRPEPAGAFLRTEVAVRKKAKMAST
jgi:DNA-binding LacI/PurR family transcriptional regulator